MQINQPPVTIYMTSIDNLPNFYRLPQGDIDALPVKPGAIILATDTDTLYVDSDKKRVSLSPVKSVTASEEVADQPPGFVYSDPEGSLYVKSDAGTFSYAPSTSETYTEVSITIPFSVSTRTEVIEFSADKLGAVNHPEFDVLTEAGENITNSGWLSRRWDGDTYIITYSGGWPVGSYKLRRRSGVTCVYSRAIFDMFYSMSSETPSGAMDLSIGHLITSCDTVFPDFWTEAVMRKAAGTIPVLTEDEWQAEVSANGSCGAFVVDEDAKSVRLPKITHVLAPGEPGTFTPAGLPNITGDFYRIYTFTDQKTASGAFSLDYYNTAVAPAANQGNGAGVTLKLDASSSSSIYGKSDTVQPPVVGAKLYIQVYNAAVPASTAQAAEFVRLLAGYLSLNGGTMTGNVAHNPKETFVILGGNDWQSSSHLILTSIEGTDSAHQAGSFELATAKGADQYAPRLVGWVDGTLRWDNKDVVCVESWKSGESWYRKYSDGWVEQGGAASSPATVTLHVAFTDTNYTALITPIVSTMGNYENIGAQSKSTTSFVLKFANAEYHYKCNWYACGFYK